MVKKRKHFIGILAALVGALLSISTLHGEPAPAALDNYAEKVWSSQEIQRDIVQYAERIGANLGLSLPSDLRVTICSDNTCFRRFTGDTRLAGVASSERGILALHAGRLGFQREALSKTLYHELIHVALGNVERGRREHLPRWFHEGVAQYFSDGMSELTSSRPESLFDSAVASETLLPFGSLRSGFPDDSDGLTLAYEQSRRFVVYIMEDLAGKGEGLSALRMLFEAMNRGVSFEDAFLQTFHKNIYLAMRDWREQLSQPYYWLLFITNNLVDIAFVLAGILFLLKAWTFRRLQRKKMEEMDDDYLDDEEINAPRQELH